MNQRQSALLSCDVEIVPELVPLDGVHEQAPEHVTVALQVLQTDSRVAPVQTPPHSVSPSIDLTDALEAFLESDEVHHRSPCTQ